MTEKELWNAFVTATNHDGDEYEAWAFGSAPDQLAQLVLTGEKTATSSAYPLYEAENEPVPVVGEYSVILDSQGNAVCVIQTKKVEVIPFRQVTEEHAYREGEGDRSLPYWRDVHETFFTECMEKAGMTFTPDMGVVCEEFEVVYPLGNIPRGS